MVPTETLTPALRGCAFLTESTEPAAVFTAEDLTPEHLAIARTTDEFFVNEVEPNLEAIRGKDYATARRVLRKAAAIGLTAVPIPERFGGMEMDLASVMLVAEHLASDASYGGWHSAHTGIGTLPVLYFGSEAQKQKYLPKLASVDLLAAYALTEPQAGSDSLGARTRADLNPEGTHYILNGQKMWITNGGAADIFTVFAKVGGDKFTAFLVERAFPGVTSGAEELKMGIKGTSTTAVYFDNVPVPVENVLGEVGRAHIIAFNVLNVGRMKLGAATTGAGKYVLGVCLKYVKQRRAFGSSISEFGAIRHKVAEMAIRIYAGESMLWRVAGLIESKMKEIADANPDPLQAELKAVEEYAAECSMIKVFCSEALNFVVDEGVQIHGGYGFHQHYAVERCYRDSRINRLFEGTNEINRLVIAGMPLKRAARGQNDILEAAAAAPVPDQNPDPEIRIVNNAKRAALYVIGQAYKKHGAALDKQQEIMMNIADMMMEVLAMESSVMRARKLAAQKKGANAAGMAAVYVRDAMARIENSARNVLGECSPSGFSLLKTLTSVDPIDAIGLRRSIAERLLGRESYGV
ncbi:MAG TPA: acyl-CoA dehydrogenase family protein [Bryobacteraceae bacterium]|jgi:alkylation response protein AidB-like acyl-CoA dehydrogenase|nr:acyl-CoA dehydrogenase family protein [Bryobacteraceae bacterium]